MRRHIAALAVLAITLAGCATDDDTTPAWAPEGYAPCATEDDPGPCYWDAQERGNGLGRSYWVDEHDAVTYVDR